MASERRSGILLHPTSLPGSFGIGSFGMEAYEFVDFLAQTRQKLWQILPLNHTGKGNCLYACISAFAGNPLMISLEKLVEDGLLNNTDLNTKERFGNNSVDYKKVRCYKIQILKKAFRNFKNSNDLKEKKYFENFCKKEKKWLDDFALFIEVKKYYHEISWQYWDRDIRFRKTTAIEEYKKLLYDAIEFQKFVQYVFYRQWHQLKNYANSKNIKIIGDIPIFVSFDSADVWANPTIFRLDRKMLPKEVSGVPPDFFSKTGQLWGNPLYDWNELKQQEYKWWLERFRKSFETNDIIRIDHFRGFEKYWAVPYGNKTATHGKWRKGPGEDFFIALKNTFGKLPVIAEDLGYITPAVIKLRDQFGIAGMKVLQFLFYKDDLINHRHENFPENSVVYTGTHDNDTTLGWYKNLSREDKKNIRKYFVSDEKGIVWGMIAHAWKSNSKYAIVPLQDILSLGNDARMNMPGTDVGDWEWRYRKNQITRKITEHLKQITKKYKR